MCMGEREREREIPKKSEKKTIYDLFIKKISFLY